VMARGVATMLVRRCPGTPPRRRRLHGE